MFKISFHGLERERAQNALCIRLKFIMIPIRFRKKHNSIRLRALAIPLIHYVVHLP